MNFPQELVERLARTGIVAGFSIDKIEHALPLADALLEGGLPVAESMPAPTIW